MGMSTSAAEILKEFQLVTIFVTYKNLVILSFGNLKVDKSTAVDINDALTFILIIIKKYSCLPHYCEKFNFLLDLSNKGCFGVSPVKFFRSKKTRN